MRSTLIRCNFLQEIMAEGKEAMVSYATAPNAGWLIGRIAYCAIHCNSVHGQLRSSSLRPSETGCGCNRGLSSPIGAGLISKAPPAGWKSRGRCLRKSGFPMGAIPAGRVLGRQGGRGAPLVRGGTARKRQPFP